MVTAPLDGTILPGVTRDSMLAMLREEGESYRSYFNRLVGFIRQHLPKEEINAEGISSSATVLVHI